MRVVALVALVLLAALTLFSQRCEGASVYHHHLAMANDDEDFRPRLYREYGAMHRRARADDDAFDDYGHLRFGRSYD